MSNFRNLALWVVVAVVLVVLFNLFQGSGSHSSATAVNYSDFYDQVVAGNVKTVAIQGDQIQGTFKNNTQFTTTQPASDPSLMQQLHDHHVGVSIAADDRNSVSLLGVLINWFPFLLVIAAWIFIIRQMQSGGGKAMGFGKSRAKLLTERQGRVTFEDVAGVDEAKDDLKEIVDFLRDPQKFQRLGGRIPKGVLLVGPPGTGKTLLARAIAGEANVPFFTISGSDFVEMFVGVGASRVRDMFEQARRTRPASSSSMKSTRSGAIAARALAAATTNASRR